MQKATEAMIGFFNAELAHIREEVDVLQVEEPLKYAPVRLKLLKYIHTPLPALSDDDRHYLFSVILRRVIVTADEFTNFEALAWFRVFGADQNALFVKAMIEDILRDRSIAKC